MISDGQRRLLQVGKRELGLNDDDYRSILSNYGGAESSVKLTARGFKAVVDRFRELGFTGQRERRMVGSFRPGMATPAQLDLIHDLWREVTRQPDKKMGKWLERYFKVSATNFLTEPTARRVIGGLRAMQRRKADARKIASEADS